MEMYKELEGGTLLQERYRIVRAIGHGGMGAVYEARHEGLAKTVALKETFFGESAAPLREAFEREARLLANLHHPGLPVVSDHFVEGGGQFLVMQFIGGDDLGHQLRQQGGQPFPVEEVLEWGDQLLDVLEYLHGHQPPVIHRDIKPQNLKVTPQGKLFLLDFGLAKGTAAEASQFEALGSVPYHTKHYAPLEQELHTGTDARSDLYSVAATLYHLLTGVLPSDALTERADAQRLGRPDPLRPLRELNPRISPAVAAPLEQALAMEREARPEAATALRQALRRAREEYAGWVFAHEAGETEDLAEGQQSRPPEEKGDKDEEPGLTDLNQEERERLGRLILERVGGGSDSGGRGGALVSSPESLGSLLLFGRELSGWGIVMLVLVSIASAIGGAIATGELAGISGPLGGVFYRATRDVALGAPGSRGVLENLVTALIPHVGALLDFALTLLVWAGTAALGIGVGILVMMLLDHRFPGLMFEPTSEAA
jgi:serine/threonine protein kinase